MLIRNLQSNDAKRMYEWMTDKSVTGWLHGDYSNVDPTCAENFIDASTKSSTEMHFCIANDEDEYMGTTSLRHIDKDNGLAEFAIVVRQDATSKGYA